MVSTSLSQPEFTIFFKNIGEIFFFWHAFSNYLTNDKRWLYKLKKGCIIAYYFFIFCKD